MSIFSQWALSICGVVILSTAVEILMPNGTVNKYIKSVLAIICMYVIISPIPKFISSGNTFSDIFFNSDQTGINYSFVQYINEKKVAQEEQDLESYLNDQGYSNVTIEIEASYVEDQIDILFVKANIKNLVIISDNKNINSNDELISLISKYMDVVKEKVLLYD